MGDAAIQTFTPVEGELSELVKSIATSLKYDVAERSQRDSRLRRARVGFVDVVEHEFEGVHRAIRTPEHIRADRSDYYMACVPMQAELRNIHEGTPIDINAGAFTFFPSDRPFSCYLSSSAPRGSPSALLVRLPGPLLRQRLPQIDDCCGRHIPIETGVGKIMHAVLEISLTQGPSLQEREAARFGDTVIDVVANAALLASEEFGWHRRLGKSSHQRLLERAKRSIEVRLSDPELDARRIADHCGISLRYLHLVFASGGLTVASYVREQRLRCCRETLQNPYLRDWSIAEVASRWGFNDLSNFSRVYKARYGLTPHLDRKCDPMLEGSFWPARDRP